MLCQKCGAELPEEAVEAVHDLPGLICLTAGGWTCGDLSCVAGMPVLDSLNIYDGLESLKGIETLDKLEIIFLDSGAASDLSPLAGLPRLRRLEIYNTPLDDLSPLATLGSLEEIGLDRDYRAGALALLPEGVEWVGP